MAKRHQFLTNTSQRQRRYFSEDFKRKKVEELDKKITRISDICKEYEVSDTAIYKWINKYSKMKKKKERLVLESESDTKKIILLKERIKELERIIGQKQILIDFQAKAIEIAEEQYKIDIKKKSGEAPSFGSGTTEKPIK